MVAILPGGAAAFLGQGSARWHDHLSVLIQGSSPRSSYSKSMSYSVCMIYNLGINRVWPDPDYGSLMVCRLLLLALCTATPRMGRGAAMHFSSHCCTAVMLHLTPAVHDTSHTHLYPLRLTESWRPTSGRSVVRCCRCWTLLTSHTHPYPSVSQGAGG